MDIELLPSLFVPGNVVIYNYIADKPVFVLIEDVKRIEVENRIEKYQLYAKTAVDTKHLGFSFAISYIGRVVVGGGDWDQGYEADWRMSISRFAIGDIEVRPLTELERLIYG